MRMMRASIITYSCATNYGAVLQTYALARVVNQFGFNVEIIDYIPQRYAFYSKEYKRNLINSTVRWKRIPIIREIWADKIIKESKTNREVFRRFLEKHVNLSNAFYSSAELKKNPPKADIYITGSDQVWNPDFLWEGEIDGPYYFDFLSDDAKRISYAASFGKDGLNKRQREVAVPLLNKYTAISVREKSGVKILNDMGLNAEEVLDPTMLAGANCFRELIVKKEKSESPFILLFQIRFDSKMYDLANKLAKEEKKELVIIMPSIQEARKHFGQKIVLPDVEDWLWYFDNADFIITDSFHGTVFSIMFNKMFASSAFAGLNGRIRNVLEICGIDNRLLTAYEMDPLKKLYNTSIEYKTVNERLHAEQNRSIKWLKNVLID